MKKWMRILMISLAILLAVLMLALLVFINTPGIPTTCTKDCGMMCNLDEGCCSCARSSCPNLEVDDLEAKGFVFVEPEVFDSYPKCAD